MDLKEKCAACSSWRWCGRPCRNMPQRVPDPVIARKPPEEARKLVERNRQRETARHGGEPTRQEPAQPGEEPGTQSKRGRPSGGKKVIVLRLDPDVITKFKDTGKGWQSRINEALRKANP